MASKNWMCTIQALTPGEKTPAKTPAGKTRMLQSAATERPTTRLKKILRTGGCLNNETIKSR